MKIKFKLTQTTHLVPQVVIDKTVSLLEGNDYRVTNLTGSVVEFDDNPWKLMWRHKAMSRLDGGKFEIGLSGSQALITFSYHVSLTAPIVIFIALSITLIQDQQYDGILFFLVFYLVTIPIHIVIQRHAAKDMLNSILSGLP